MRERASERERARKIEREKERKNFSKSINVTSVKF